MKINSKSFLILHIYSYWLLHIKTSCKSTRVHNVFILSYSLESRHIPTTFISDAPKNFQQEH